MNWLSDVPAWVWFFGPMCLYFGHQIEQLNKAQAETNQWLRRLADRLAPEVPYED